MSDLLTRLKDLLLDNKTSNIPEIKFLQESDITLTINRGFTELYRAKPENPILFLSKWLSRESRAKELEKKYKDNKIKKENLEIKYYQKEKYKHILKERDYQTKKVRKDDENSLIQEIKDCKDFWLGFNHICERLKTLTNATGCYIGIYDQKRRPVKEDDDMDGHLDPSGTKVLRYIGWNNDHSFLDGLCLEPNQGVTYDLITPKPAQGGGEAENPNQENKNLEQNQQNPNEGEKKEKVEEIKLEDTVKSLLIDDVVNDNRIKFFKEPRLGCYLALDLTYKTSLSYNSLLSAIQCTKNYEASKEEQETRKKEWSEKQEDIKNQINELKDAKIKEEEARKIAEEKALEAEAKAKLAENDPNKPPEEKKDNPPPQQGNTSQGNINKNNSMEHGESIEALEKQLTEWSEEPVKLQDYDKEEKNIYMCLDTLGQDRIFNDEEIKYIKIVGANIRDSLERLEQSLLEKDRDIRIKFLDNEAKLKTEEKYSDEKFEECVNNYISQFYASEEYKSKGITDEDTKSFEGDLQKLKYLKNILLEGDCQNILLTFQEFEFVEFSKAFQNLLYFCRANPLDINEQNTNKLEWKKAKKYWSNIFSYATNYNPLGPKPEEVKSIYKLNKIKENLELAISKRDEVKAYSQTLLMFIDFILFLIKVRHDDIIRRVCNVAILKDKREQIIKTNAEIDEERQKIIDEAKAANPNVKIPGEGGAPLLPQKKEVEEKNEEEKKEEEKKQEEKPKEEQNVQQAEQENPQANNNGEENKEGGEEQAQEKIDESDSIKLAEQLMKFDEEHVKQEVPPDVEYDIDNDYDIDQSEKDTIINVALEAAKNPSPSPLDKKGQMQSQKAVINPPQS